MLKPSCFSFLFLLTLCLAVNGSAAVLDRSGFRDLSAELGNPIVFTESFDNPLSGWQLMKDNDFRHPVPLQEAPGIQVLRGAGVNGTSALSYERKPGDPYYILSKRFPMEPGLNYECTFLFRSEIADFSHTRNTGAFQDTISGLGIQYWQDNYNWVISAGSGAKHRELPPGQWDRASFPIMLPPNPGTFATCDIYLRGEVLGRFLIDEIEIRVVGRTAAHIFPLNSSLRIDADGRIRIFVQQEGQPRPPENLALLFKIGTEEKMTHSQNSTYECIFPDLPEGRTKLSLEFLDLKEKEIIARETYILTRSNATPPKGAATIDRHGRTIVDGKPFFPIAIFSGFSRPPTVEHLKEWKAGGFNSLMYYHPIKYLHIDGKKATQAEDILSSLDQMENHGLKMIFSLFYQHMIKPHGNREEFDDVRGLDQVTEHVVNLVKDHPAMLAYYVSDENSLEEYPAVRALRERISKIDLWHPTVTLTNNSNFFAPCCKTGDILSYDYYPVRTVPLEKQTIDYYDLRYAGALGVPHWFTAQAMQWTRDRAKGARSPQIQELRAMCFAALIFNCKGFMFYSYPSMLELIDIDEAEGIQLWSNIQTIAKEISQLSEWILSLEKAPAVKIKQNNTGDGAPAVLARAFMAGNKMKVLLVSNGPGAADAILELPGNFRSVHGLTTKTGQRTYRFQAKYVTADLLVQE